MVLLAAVIVYVVVSQLMLIPDKNAIRALADRVDEAYMSAITLSDEQLAALEDPAALSKKTDEVMKALDPYFVTDSPYKTEEPIVTLRDNIQNQLLGVDRYEKQELQKPNTVSAAYRMTLPGCRFPTCTASVAAAITPEPNPSRK